MNALAVAVVHHANQYLITDGYDNRDGITRVTEGFQQVLDLHEQYGIPASLHLSGTLVEALAWHHPWFLDRVKDLLGRRLLSLVGGAYADNVMTLFPADFNRRQVEEVLWLYGELLDFPPERVRTFWVPERVWDTEVLAPVLADPDLTNGGYRRVLLDDRLLFSAAPSYPGSPRAAFDSRGPFGLPLAPSERQSRTEAALKEAARPYRIVDGRGLTVVPVSANMRYWVPIRSPQHLEHLDRSLEALAGSPGTLLLYADDLEKTAGVAGWETPIEGYEAFLCWIGEQGERLTPVLIDDWVDANPPAPERFLEPGTFYELARSLGAGEDYSGWSESPAWSDCRRHFSMSFEAVRTAEAEGADHRLVDSAWKHLLASSHETAWHDRTEDGKGRAPAPWARAMAAHARACLPVVAAATWFTKGDNSPKATLADVDADGETEVVLRTREAYAVVTPSHGGRIVYLFHRSSFGGVLSVGNPTDHWNFQETMNRYMDVPPNHPGGLADVGFEHDRYRVASLSADPGHAWVQMVNETGGSPLAGSRKTLLLDTSAPALVVCYELPETVHGLATEMCLSPDYFRLLREGRRHLVPCGGSTWRGWRTGPEAAWVAVQGEEQTVWAEPVRPRAGHGLNVRVRSDTGHFHLLLGCGPADDDLCGSLLTAGAEAIHTRARDASAEGRTVETAT